MKRIINILALLQVCFIAAAQPLYPTAPPAPGTIIRVEYFVRPFGGTDPGFGNGGALAITPQQNINGYSEAINLGALPQGYYRVYIRSLDADGRWSVTNAAAPFAYIITPVYPSAPSAVTNIVRLEYAIDANVPFGNGASIPLTPGSNIANLNAVIDISSLPAGPHILYIRSLDADGKWGVTNIRFFSNAAIPNYPIAPPAAGNIQTLEYFIDTDPGFGLATAIPITPGTDVTVTNFPIPTTGLSNGIHQLYIRSRNNPWGVTTVQSFLVGTSLPVTWLYVTGQLTTQGAKIEWATAAESQTNKFEIEHSTDGVNFIKVGVRAAAGNSSSTRQYEFIHPSPVAGRNFYRIKQIDLDGRFTYSAVIVLNNATAKNVFIAPNPVQQATTLYFKETGSKILRLLNANGQVLLIQQVQQGNSTHVIDMGHLPAGTYLLQVQSSSETETHQLIKK